MENTMTDTKGSGLEKKDLTIELEKVKNMVKDKINKENGFPPFIISYSIANGNRMVQVDRWETEGERYNNFKKVVNWAKSEQPYGVIFGSLNIRQSYKTQEDFDARVNGEEHHEALLFLKTPDKSLCVCIEFTGEEGKYAFIEEVMDTNSREDRSLLDEIFMGVN